MPANMILTKSTDPLRGRQGQVLTQTGTTSGVVQIGDDANTTNIELHMQAGGSVKTFKGGIEQPTALSMALFIEAGYWPV